MKLYQQFLKSKERKVLEWSTNSSGLNPIKNLLAISKQLLRKYTVPENLEEQVSELLYRCC